MSTFPPGCFSCHVDCASGCTDDQPYDHPYALTTNYDAEDAPEEIRPPNSSEPRAVQPEASALMRFVLWVLDVKTDTSF